MLRSQTVVFFLISFLALVSARVVDRRQLTSAPFNPSTVTHIATEVNLPAPTSISTSESSEISTTRRTATNSVPPAPTAPPTDNSDDGDDQGGYAPPPPSDESYYDSEGADGKSTGFINVSIGAQAGIIVAIVLVGLAIMGGCIWFWNKKQAEWKAALERRRTLRASRVAAAKTAGISTGKNSNKKGNEKKPSGLSKEVKTSHNESTSSLVSAEAKPAEPEPEVERSQFDVMTPTESENPSWWKKVLPKKK